MCKDANDDICSCLGNKRKRYVRVLAAMGINSRSNAFLVGKGYNTRKKRFCDISVHLGQYTIQKSFVIAMVWGESKFMVIYAQYTDIWIIYIRKYYNFAMIC